MTKTAKEVFIKHALLSKIDGKTPDEKEINEALEHKDMKFVLDAMEEYATSKLSVQVKEEENAIKFAEWILQKEFIPVNQLGEKGEYWSALFDGRYTINELYQLFLTEKGKDK